MEKLNVETAKLETKYCIPEWLRDTQIQLSTAKFPNRFKPIEELKTDPIAIVCFGNSLNQTWEKIKDFKYIMTCSGSHKFLRERGFTPAWHVEVDPRKHKIELIGDDISPETEFLMASCCHPEVFAHLEKHNAKITLWHTYSGEDTKTLPLVYPRNEWVSTGGANVGLRSFVLARMLGFTDLHIFGMDGNFPMDGKLKHAAYHPNIAKSHIIAEFEGKEYATTVAFLDCARSTFHEIEMLPDVNITFYGDGLIQDMAKKKLPELKKQHDVSIAFLLPDTISAEYRQQNRLLHQTNAQYGVSALKYLDIIKDLYFKTECKSLLDYGCGKGLLAKNLEFPIWEYDPAIEGKDKSPKPADLVVCIDVLEHIEPDYLDLTLQDIARCILKIGYFTVNTKEAKKTLPDGRNTHLIIKDKKWWREKLSQYFEVPGNGLMEKGAELHIIVAPKKFIFNKEKFRLKAKEIVDVH